MIDAPAPDKTPFGKILTAETLTHFIHPGGIPKFERPFLHNGIVHTCNGWLAVRFDKIDPAGFEENPEASASLAKVPLNTVEALTCELRWRNLDEGRLSLYKFPPRAIWERSRVCYHPMLRPLVRVGFCLLAPLPLLQLVARLPQPAIWCDGSPSCPTYIRFRGGVAVIAPMPAEVQNADDINIAFNLFPPPLDPFTKLPDWEARRPRTRPTMLQLYPPSGLKNWPPKECHPDDLPTIIQD